ncbi:endolytic transglycosylase MltG [Vagococcus coleopterorum]|uniref:Endolytic murein transglycosylase n=2 Tax=Vagococcus coleopterorum TaxID=2714946 RepID=A0A6G8APJ0_9ENTE|nr:endolytic transglycosylase MltG [Vagococcus coleopterorum]
MKRREMRQKENNMVKKIVTIVLSAVVLISVVAGFAFYKYWQNGLQPLNPKDHDMVQVEIPLGTSNKQIGNILEKSDVIKSGLVFNYYVKANNISDFKGGFYQMSPDMKLVDIAKMLQQGGSDEPTALADGRITIPEGSSLYQIAEIMEKNTDVKVDEFIDAAKNPKLFDKLYESYPELLESVKDAKDVRYRLEGYLFPASYNYYKENGVDDLITQMVKRSAEVMAQRKADIAASKLTVQELLTLASLVEKEGVELEDRQNIAQVFLNRIDEEMPLQSDISILYAMDEHKVHLSNKDTQVDSPYNLYTNKGYGPGPFNSPSEEAIDAVLHPKENDYIYFLADVSTHKVYFAKTYEEHLKLKEEYIDKQLEKK